MFIFLPLIGPITTQNEIEIKIYPLQNHRNKCFIPILVELNIKYVFILFGSKVLYITFSSGGYIGNIQISYLPPPRINHESMGELSAWVYVEFCHLCQFSSVSPNFTTSGQFEVDIPPLQHDQCQTTTKQNNVQNHAQFFGCTPHVYSPFLCHNLETLSTLLVLKQWFQDH